MNRNQTLLRHFLAAIAYRTAKALRDVTLLADAVVATSVTLANPADDGEARTTSGTVIGRTRRPLRHRLLAHDT